MIRSWPDAVAIERAVLMAQGDVVRAADLALRVEGQGQAALEDMKTGEQKPVPLAGLAEAVRGQ